MQHFCVAGTTAKAAGPPPPASRRNPGAHGWLLRQAERLEVARAAGLQRAAAHAAARPKVGHLTRLCRRTAAQWPVFAALGSCPAAVSGTSWAGQCVCVAGHKRGQTLFKTWGPS